jgi:arylsulfatase A-like enzyme
MNRYLKIVLCCAAMSPGLPSQLSAAPERPNLIIVLLDDLGYGDLACYGNPQVTSPHIDQLATEGIRFTQAYAAGPVCSPGRAGLMTGRWPARSGITDAIGAAVAQWNDNRRLLPPANARRLALEEITLAEVLRDQGYATGNVGKWHLGAEGFLPLDQGFDFNFSGNQIGSHKSMFGPDYGINLGPVEAGEYLTDRLQAEAEAFIQRSRDQPFFLLLSHFAVHRPVGAKAETIARQPPRSTDPVWGLVPEYAAMIEDVDTSIGRLRQFLAEEGLAENTVIVLTSDNGGVRFWSSNGGLRGTKGTVYEAGLRVPLIALLPGMTGAGRIEASPVHAVDLWPTLLALAQGAPPADLVLDGLNLLPRLTAGSELPSRDFFWHFPHYNMHGSTPASALRSGDYKLIEWHETGQIELYDLGTDASESHDLAAARPELKQALLARLHHWQRTTGAQLPRPNPDYPGTEPDLPELSPFISTRLLPPDDPFHTPY